MRKRVAVRSHHDQMRRLLIRHAHKFFGGQSPRRTDANRKPLLFQNRLLPLKVRLRQPKYFVAHVNPNVGCRARG